MTKTTESEWNVLRHGPIETLAENVWRVTGALPGMSLERTMTIVRREDGTLLLHSVIALDEANMQALLALGRPTIMLVPNAGHKLDAPAYKARFPELRVYGPRGGREQIEEALPLDGTYEDFPEDAVTRVETLEGVSEGEGALIVQSEDGVTLVLNDCVMNMDKKKDVLGYVFTTLMGSAPGPRVSRFVRLMFVSDQRALRAHLERLASLPKLTRLIVSHEKVEHGEAARRALLQAITYLKGGDAHWGVTTTTPE
jgi:hypothetical protein